MKTLFFVILWALCCSAFAHDFDWWCDCSGTVPGYEYTTGGNTSGTVGTYTNLPPTTVDGTTGHYTNTTGTVTGGTVGTYPPSTGSPSGGTTGTYGQESPGQNQTGTVASYKETPRLALTLSGVIVTQGGTPGTTYVVEASEDLVHWAKVGEVTSDLSGNQNFTVAFDRPKRFYRVSH